MFADGAAPRPRAEIARCVAPVRVCFVCFRRVFVCLLTFALASPIARPLSRPHFAVIYKLLSTSPPLSVANHRTARSCLCLSLTFIPCLRNIRNFVIWCCEQWTVQWLVKQDTGQSVKKASIIERGSPSLSRHPFRTSFLLAGPDGRPTRVCYHSTQFLQTSGAGPDGRSPGVWTPFPNSPDSRLVQTDGRSLELTITIKLLDFFGWSRRTARSGVARVTWFRTPWAGLDGRF